LRIHSITLLPVAKEVRQTECEKPWANAVCPPSTRDTQLTRLVLRQA
jgi:hypothetical protein